MDDDHQHVLEVGVLGPVRVRAAGRELDLGGPRQRALLAVLALHIGSTVLTDTLVDAVWDGAPPPAAARTFRTYVARLRKSLTGAGSGVGGAVAGTDVVRTDPAGYRLDDAYVGLDAHRYVATLDRAREGLASGDAAGAAHLLEEALATWRGPAFGQFADRHWAQADAVRLEELRVVGRELHVEALLDAGRTQDAVVDAGALVHEHPLRESVARLLVLGHYRTGRHADAIDAVRRFRERLAEQTGLDPSARVDELERMVLSQDPRLDRPVAGRRLRGYLLHEVVATTGLGVVHRAEQPSIGREVAITVVGPERADDPEVVRTFATRAQEVAAVEHPHVVPLYDYWREPGGAYLVTRLPAGGTLAERIARGPVPREEAARLVRQVGGALVAAHERGVVHGAVGAASVLLDARGDAVLAGFPLVAAGAGPQADLVGLADLAGSLLAPAPGADAAGRDVAADVLAAARDPKDDRVAVVADLVDALDVVLTGSAAPVARGAAAAAGPNPYRGLAAFRETDAAVFFGREDLATEVLARLRRQPFVAVSGPSGSGKSSLVRAGVLPRLRSAGAYVTTMVPGGSPLAELVLALTRIAAVSLDRVEERLVDGRDGLTGLLAEVLPEPEGDAVLVVDQFEELFTLTPASERQVFLEVLAAALDHPLRRLRVVATVRADFLGRVLDDPVGGALVQHRTVLTRTMTADELHEAVVGPAEVAGVAVEPALATAIVADGARSPGSLPMVQFALTEVYEAAGGGTMTLADYRRLGGIEGVLGQRAEEVHAGLDDDGRTASRALFQRLVAPNDDGPPTRRRARRAELVAVPDAVVEAFGAARLLRFGHDDATREPTVEVTHEALFRAWPRLVAWVEAGADDLRLLGHLTASSTEWDVGGRQDAELYRGGRLEAALAFADEHGEQLTDVERTYLTRGRLRAEEAHDRERARHRRLRLLTSGLAVGLVAALVGGGLAWSASQQEAEVRVAAQADALAFAASATVDEDLELAALYAAEAYALAPDVESQAALLSVLGDEPQVRRFVPSQPLVVCGSPAPGGELVVHQRVPRDGAPTADVRTADFAMVGRVPLPRGVRCPSVGRDAQHVYAGSVSDGSLRALAVPTGEVVAERGGWQYPDAPMALVQSPTRDEALVHLSDGEGIERIRLPDLATIAALPVPRGATGLLQAAYAETGDLVAATTDDGRVVVVEPSGAVRASEPVPTQLWHVAVAEQAGLVLAHDDSALYATSVDAPGELRAVPLGGSPVWSPVVHPDGDLVVVPTTVGLRLLSLPSLEPVGPIIGVETTFGQASWGPGGRLLWMGPVGLVTIDIDRTVGTGERIATTASGAVTFPAGDGASALRYDDDGRWSVDLATGAERLVSPPEADEQTVNATLPGGEYLTVDVGEGVVQRWDGGSLAASGRLPEHVPPDLFRFWSQLGVHAGVAATSFGTPGADGVPGDEWVLAVDVATAATVAAFPYATVDDQGAPRAALARVHPMGDDRILVTTQDSLARIVDHDGDVVVAPRRVIGGGETLAVAPGSELLAVVGFTGDIAIVDDALEPVVTLTGPASVATFLRFAGRDHLISRHQDGATRIWDVGEGRLLGELFRSEAFLPYGFEVSEDGRSVVHAVPGGVARIPIDPAAWLAGVCDLVTRDVTPRELDAVVEGREAAAPCAGTA